MRPAPDRTQAPDLVRKRAPDTARTKGPGTADTRAQNSVAPTVPGTVDTARSMVRTAAPGPVKP
ncbi:hypothetical protein GCM10023335_70070 [Streptomyces siamensis]|uniref:Uncharacterized protein n=1 Tax=Streptomyces siamensis TaxID=1274986 RepID=A0ABP9JF45_9ACTN